MAKKTSKTSTPAKRPEREPDPDPRQPYFAVRLPLDLQPRVQAAAQADDRSGAWVVRRAVEEWLTQHGY